MPEGITPSSEKLVPIDTSGNAVDVTLKEDKKDDVVATTNEESPIVEVQEEQSTEVVQETAPQENKEDEVRVKGTFPIWGGSRRRPRIVDYRSFEGTKRGNWIFLDTGGKKKANGNHITFYEI